ncbi:hypothetical protein FIBSPDRAFT_1047975 [Athelia psychrophila]|uniref:Uncharacterized protein n=1 Tax=Athelia psychrophila TaxID=1759441 RepID=A0A166EBB8_9AGAM|nr:hypothetical protein FIBSPDRAFT_1047975 [Fibularhizoctonia sp. CBS 109695]
MTTAEENKQYQLCRRDLSHRPRPLICPSNTFEVNAVDHEYTVCHRHRPLASVLTPMAPVTIVIACQPVLTYSI